MVSMNGAYRMLMATRLQEGLPEENIALGFFQNLSTSSTTVATDDFREVLS